ncbi:CHAT domain-containing protein [Herbidospora galbida]|uniref:CHAT domain-containing protein n=1 Tax=Herbidospora galbida TaxID=2575442 RepID=UPI001484DC95|nr:CHAT domain-containing protein [Herbidospora galbida]
MVYPRVFISYAHDDDDHVEKVRTLWAFLRANGVNAGLDESAAREPQFWPDWMSAQIRDADFVLVIASPEYRRAADGETPPTERRGVRWEAREVKHQFNRQPDDAGRKFLSVVLPGGRIDDIPAFLTAESRTYYTVTEFTVAGAEGLLRYLLGQPQNPHDPPILAAPELRPRPLPAIPLRHEVVLRVRAEGATLTCETTVSGTVLGTVENPRPYGIDDAWHALRLRGGEAEQRLLQTGGALARALLSEETIDHLTTLLTGSALGTVVEVVCDVDAGSSTLPYELITLNGVPLVTMPGAQMRRRMADVGHTAVAPLPGPLKILVAVSAPDENTTRNAPLDVEAEMQAVLDAVADVQEMEQVQVRILEVPSSAEITKALQQDQYHILHLSAHGNPLGVELSDEDGSPEPVDTNGLVEVLRAGTCPLPLIVVSACAGAAPAPDRAEGLAATLIRQGADRVLAMQASVSDVYATDLARRFYNALAAKPETTPSHALAVARRELEGQRRRATADKGRPEYGVTTLLCAQNDPPLRTNSGPSQPLSRAIHPPAGGSVRALPIGSLIGRRPELRAVMNVLRGHPSVRDLGDISGAVLTGIGGIGKTAVAGRAMSRLGNDGWTTVVHEGLWNPLGLIGSVAGAFEGNPDVQRHLVDLTTDDTTKISIIGQLLHQARLLIVFDDFEQNLSLDGGRFTDDGFAEIFTQFCQQAHRGRILVTCRYPLPDNDFLVDIPIPPLSPAELRRMLLRLPALRDLSPEDRRTLMVTIGGHPRLLEFVNALLNNGRAQLKEVTTKLRELARDHHITLTAEPTLETAVDEAVLLGTRDILLEQLLGLLSTAEKNVLLQCAISRAPMSVEDVVWAVHGETRPAEAITVVTAAVNRLVDLTLLSSTPEGEVVIHTWIATALAEHRTDEVESHRRALAMRFNRLSQGRGGYPDLLEIAHHLEATDQSEELVGFALAVADMLANQSGELSVASFLGEITSSFTVITRHHIHLLDREARAHILTGDLTTAASRLNILISTIEQLAVADPTNAQAQRDLSVSHERLGDLLTTRGDLDTAHQHHTASLHIRESLAAADPSNAEAQRDLSISHERLGDLLTTRGDLDTAHQHHTASLHIRESLAAADPSNAEAQRDLSISHGRLGDLLAARGDLDTAHQYYTADLLIAEKLAAADPSNAEAQRDLSVSHSRIGELLAARGDLDTAHRHYTASLRIAEKLAAADPTNAQAQRDLSVSHNKIGELLAARGDLDTAHQYYTADLLIAEKLAAADPSNAEAQRDLSVSHSKIGELLAARGDLDTAYRHHTADLRIAEKLAAADPTNAQAQRDLEISLMKMANIQDALGHPEEAARYRQRIPSRDGTDA